MTPAINMQCLPVPMIWTGKQAESDRAILTETGEKIITEPENDEPAKNIHTG